MGLFKAVIAAAVLALALSGCATVATSAAAGLITGITGGASSYIATKLIEKADARINPANKGISNAIPASAGRVG